VGLPRVELPPKKARRRRPIQPLLDAQRQMLLTPLLEAQRQWPGPSPPLPYGVLPGLSPAPHLDFEVSLISARSAVVESHRGSPFSSAPYTAVGPPRTPSGRILSSACVESPSRTPWWELLSEPATRSATAASHTGTAGGEARSAGRASEDPAAALDRLVSRFPGVDAELLAVALEHAQGAADIAAAFVQEALRIADEGSGEEDEEGNAAPDERGASNGAALEQEVREHAQAERASVEDVASHPGLAPLSQLTSVQWTGCAPCNEDTDSEDDSQLDGHSRMLRDKARVLADRYIGRHDRLHNYRTMWRQRQVLKAQRAEQERRRLGTVAGVRSAMAGAAASKTESNVSIASISQPGPMLQSEKDDAASSSEAEVEKEAGDDDGDLAEEDDAVDLLPSTSGAVVLELQPFFKSRASVLVAEAGRSSRSSGVSFAHDDPSAEVHLGEASTRSNDRGSLSGWRDSHASDRGAMVENPKVQKWNDKGVRHTQKHVTKSWNLDSQALAEPQSPTGDDAGRPPTPQSRKSDASALAPGEGLLMRERERTALSVEEAMQIGKAMQLHIDFIRARMVEFLRLDEDQCGSLTRAQFFQAVQAQLQDMGVDPEDYKQRFWRTADADVSGTVDFEEYLNWYITVSSPVPKEGGTEKYIKSLATQFRVPIIDIEKVITAWEKFAQAHNGFVNRVEFEELLRSLIAPRSKDKFDLPEGRLRRWWVEADADHDGYATFEQFLKWYIMHFAPARRTTNASANSNFGYGLSRTNSGGSTQGLRRGSHRKSRKSTEIAAAQYYRNLASDRMATFYERSLRRNSSTLNTG